MIKRMFFSGPKKNNERNIIKNRIYRNETKVYKNINYLFNIDNVNNNNNYIIKNNILTPKERKMQSRPFSNDNRNHNEIYTSNKKQYNNINKISSDENYIEQFLKELQFKNKILKFTKTNSFSSFYTIIDEKKNKNSIIIPKYNNDENKIINNKRKNIANHSEKKINILKVNKNKYIKNN